MEKNSRGLTGLTLGVDTCLSQEFSLLGNRLLPQGNSYASDR